MCYIEKQRLHLHVNAKQPEQRQAKWKMWQYDAINTHTHRDRVRERMNNGEKYHCTPSMYNWTIVFYTVCNFSIYRMIHMCCLSYLKCVYFVDVCLCLLLLLFFCAFYRQATTIKLHFYFPGIIFLFSSVFVFFCFVFVDLDLDIGFILT